MRALAPALLAAAACAPALPDGVAWAEAPADALQWANAGHLALVTPVRPPTTADRTARISVYLDVPTGPATVGALPAGTTAVRVEYRGSTDPDADVAADWEVLDVRQFEWTPEGKRCTVLRPAPGGRLGGVSWRCGARADAVAAEVLAQLVRAGRLLGPSDPARREAAATRLAGLNDCTGCHRPNRPEDRSDAALVQRSTDADGLFSLRSVLSDEGPVERYRPVDPNRTDPFLHPVCPDGVAAAGRCPDGLRPRMRLDVAAGRAAADPHVEKVCAARRALAALFDGAKADLGACGAAR